MTTPSDISWSHTALSSFRECPYCYFKERVLKEVPFKETEAPRNGRRVHKSLENRVGLGTPLPPEHIHLEPLAAETAALRNTGGILEVERQITINNKFEPTSWFGKDAWFRCANDVLVKWPDQRMAFIVDWKTGKYRGDSGQAKLNALSIFMTDTAIDTVMTCFAYVDDRGKKIRDTFHRGQTTEILTGALSTLTEIARATDSGVWVQKPSALCKWCGVTSCPSNPNRVNHDNLPR